MPEKGAERAAVVAVGRRRSVETMGRDRIGILTSVISKEKRKAGMRNGRCGGEVVVSVRVCGVS